MTAAKTSKDRPRLRQPVYEMRADVPIYYRDDRAVLRGEKRPEEIAGSSKRQTLLC